MIVSLCSQKHYQIIEGIHLPQQNQTDKYKLTELSQGQKIHI